jgi:hypothetical protein
MSKKVRVMFLTVLILLLCLTASAIAKEIIDPIPYDETNMVLPVKKLNLDEEQKNSLYEKAKKYGIVTDDLTDEQIHEKVIQKDNDAMIAKAKQAGIPTDGLTPFEVYNLINERDKEQPKRLAEEERKFFMDEALTYGIDTTGLSYEQIKEMVKEKLMPQLIKSAIELGVDYEGLNYDKLSENIESKYMENFYKNNEK